nr:zinc finger protein 391 [Nothobranchius furzeri]
MSSAQSLREFIRERLTAAAAEIFSEFEKTIDRYEEELDRQRRLLEVRWKPQIRLHRTELPLHDVRTDEEVLTDQQLWNQEGTSSLEQEQPETPQMNSEQDEPEGLQILEQEEFCISQDEEQLGLKLENVTSFVTPADEERDHDEPEPNRHQLISSGCPEADFRVAAPLGSTELPRHPVCEREEVLTYQQFSNQETTSSLDQKEPEPPLIKDEQQELCFHQHERPFILKQENVTFMLTPPFEETESCEPEPNRNQPSCQSSTEAENQDQNGFRNENPEPKSNEELTQNKRSQQTKDDRDWVYSQKRKRHQRPHRGERPFSCKLCEKSFSHKLVLTLHMRTHTSEKPFPCEACGKCFLNSSSLIKHIKMHTGEKPHPCEACGSCFISSRTLTRHMRTCTGEKPYRCKTCNKCFAETSALSSHRKTHTGEKPHSCEACGKCFTGNSTLTRHMRTHTGEKPFPCEACGKLFSRSDHLNRHMRTQHS